MDLSQIEQLFLDQGFTAFSHANLKTSYSFEIYKAQVWQKNVGEMQFLEKHMPLKDPKNEKSFKTACIGIYPYYPVENEIKSHLKLSLYSQQKDYHQRLTQKLEIIKTQIQKKHPKEVFKVGVDSSPVLERDLAYKAGLGWIGKNTCLINKKAGSLFFIAEILTSLDFSTSASLATDHCGTCNKCIEACPTGALSPRKMEVKKCISYRNIEDKDVSAQSLNKPIHSWFFGCDICQTICPWNEKAHTKEKMLHENLPFEVTPQAVSELKEILSSSNKSLEKKYSAFPLSRSRAKGLKRNALKIIYEYKISELKNFLEDTPVSENLEDLKDVVLQSLENTLKS